MFDNQGERDYFDLLARGVYCEYFMYALCYKLYSNKYSWQEAREYCIRDGGDLVVFDNQGERDYFDLLARGIYGEYIYSK